MGAPEKCKGSTTEATCQGNGGKGKVAQEQWMGAGQGEDQAGGLRARGFECYPKVFQLYQHSHRSAETKRI